MQNRIRRFYSITLFIYLKKSAEQEAKKAAGGEEKAGNEGDEDGNEEHGSENGSEKGISYEI